MLTLKTTFENYYRYSHRLQFPHTAYLGGSALPFPLQYITNKTKTYFLPSV